MTAPVEVGAGAALRVLLGAAIDYAGLFPPAGLRMPDAVRNYAAYRSSTDAWALGRFIVPASRLRELSDAASDLLPPPGARAPWRVGVLISSDVAGDLLEVDAFHTRHPGSATVDAVELKAATPALVEQALDLTTRGETYVEVPIGDDAEPMVEAIARVGARAKIRTGGTTPDAFPTSGQVARFIAACARYRVPFKATAGLHHPVCGSYPLTYAPGSESASMFGFLNVLLSGVLALELSSGTVLEELLRESDPRAFRVADDGVRWRDLLLSTERVAYARANAVAGFGSCSFEEPLSELRAVELLP
jgi:hypothetical protein